MKKKFNYNKSIVNLMSSIQRSFGTNSKYQELNSLKTRGLNKTEDVILLIIDGLGYNFLLKKSESKFFIKYLTDRLSSVFLATTSTSLTSFFTGLPPISHLITGWRVYLREVGIASELISFKTRSGKIPLEKYGLKIDDFFKSDSIFSKIKSKSLVVYPKNLVGSCFSNKVTKGASVLPYDTLQGMFKQLRRALVSSNERKFIFAYWQNFDSECHKFGTSSEEVKKHFQKIENGVKKLMNSLSDKKFTLIITADHGLIDYKKEDIVNLHSHPELSKMLTVPLCGEARVAYCYVKPDKREQFEKYVKKNMQQYCWLKKSDEIMSDGWFGQYEGCSDIRDRIGDYLLIMKKNYIIQDNVPGEPQLAGSFNACHGGVSNEEVYVPLIVMRSQ